MLPSRRAVTSPAERSTERCWLMFGTARRDGSTVYYRLADPKVLEACQLLQSLAR